MTQENSTVTIPLKEYESLIACRKAVEKRSSIGCYGVCGINYFYEPESEKQVTLDLIAEIKRQEADLQRYRNELSDLKRKKKRGWFR